MDAFNPPHSLHLMPSTMPPGTPIADTATPAAAAPAGTKPFATTTTTASAAPGRPGTATATVTAMAAESCSDTDSGTGSDSDTDASPDIPSTSYTPGSFCAPGRRLMPKPVPKALVSHDTSSTASSPSTLIEGLSIHSQSSQMAQPASQLARGGHGHDSALHTSTGTPTVTPAEPTYPMVMPSKSGFLKARRRQRIQCFEAGDYSHLGVKSAAASTPPAQPVPSSSATSSSGETSINVPVGKNEQAPATMSCTNAFTQTGGEVLTAQDWTGIPEFPLDEHMRDPFDPALAPTTPARSSTPRDTAMADTPPLLAVPMASFSAATTSGIAPPSRTPAEWTTSGFFASSSSTPCKLRVIPPKAPATGSIRRRDTMRPVLQRQDTLELDPDVLVTPPAIVSSAVDARGAPPPEERRRNAILSNQKVRQNALMPTPPRPRPVPAPGALLRHGNQAQGVGGQMGTKMASSELDGSFSSTSTVELDAHSPPHQSLLSGFESLSDAEDPPAVYRGPTDPLPKSCLKRAAKRARDDSEADDHDVGDALGTGLTCVTDGPVKRFRFAGVNSVKEFDWTDQCFKLGEERVESAMDVDLTAQNEMGQSASSTDEE